MVDLFAGVAGVAMLMLIGAFIYLLWGHDGEDPHPTATLILMWLSSATASVCGLIAVCFWLIGALR
jgi:hypothetical protein